MSIFDEQQYIICRILISQHAHMWQTFKFKNRFIPTDVPCQHRRYKCRREPAAHPAHGPLPSPPPSGVERLACIKNGSLWMSNCVNIWPAVLLMENTTRAVTDNQTQFCRHIHTQRRFNLHKHTRSPLL